VGGKDDAGGGGACRVLLLHAPPRAQVSSPSVTACLLLKTELLCIVPFPGSVDSTTVQNIVIIAIASILHRKSNYKGLLPYEYTA
jgi:hypothetical protein